MSSVVLIDQEGEKLETKVTFRTSKLKLRNLKIIAAERETNITALLNEGIDYLESEYGRKNKK